jgi:hypothetical protein
MKTNPTETMPKNDEQFESLNQAEPANQVELPNSPDSSANPQPADLSEAPSALPEVSELAEPSMPDSTAPTSSDPLALSASDPAAPTSSDLAAPSASDPAASSASDPSDPPLFTQSEVTRLVDEAYLRGKNEAIKAKILEETATRIDTATETTPGLESIFTFREKIW